MSLLLAMYCLKQGYHWLRLRIPLGEGWVPPLEKIGDLFSEAIQQSRKKRQNQGQSGYCKVYGTVIVSLFHALWSLLLPPLLQGLCSTVPHLKNLSTPFHQDPCSTPPQPPPPPTFWRSQCHHGLQVYFLNLFKLLIHPVFLCHSVPVCQSVFFTC